MRGLPRSIAATLKEPQAWKRDSVGYLAILAAALTAALTPLSARACALLVRDGHNVTVRGWLVYLLECGDGTLYTGITLDLRRRLAAHRRGAASKYTRTRLPVRVIYQEPHHTRSSALRREAFIKTLTHRGKIGLILSSPSSSLPKSPP